MVGAVGSLMLFLNLRSDGFVVFLFPIIKEHSDSDTEVFEVAETE